jgi:tetratricopeptide (TPR) repeat protein
MDHGDFAAAESTFVRALEIAERALGTTSGTVIDMRGNLAIVYANTGRLDEGVAALERAWSDAKAADRPPDRSLAGLASNLAGMHEVAGNGERARALQAEALELTRDLMGETSTDYGQALVQSAALGRADPAAALPLADRGLALLLDKLDESSPQVANGIIIRGGLLERLGRCDDALTELERGRAIIEASMGAEHALVGEAWLSIAECHIRQRKFTDAVIEAGRARVILRAATGRLQLPAETCLIRAQIGARELTDARANLEALRTWARAENDEDALAEIEALTRSVAAK